MAERKRSEVWKYFKIVDETAPKKCVKCSFCTTELSYDGSSTGSTSNYVKLKHPFSSRQKTASL